MANSKSLLSVIGLALAGTFTLPSCSAEGTDKHQNVAAEIFFADPTIYAENGKFYLTGTRNREPLGFALLESDNLQTWQYARPDSMIMCAGPHTFGTMGFWAPQILKYNDEYYMAYTANEQTALAKTDSVNGEYRQAVLAPIDGSEKNIDPFLFQDDDGKW